MTSDKKNIALLADIFVKKGLSDIVISPGSRNAPIILSFANQPEIKALSIVDERSAGFFALGMAQQKGKAVALACSSGSAVLNYAPPIAEAYYQKIPLLILTADRPPELIDKGDGQTIRQKDVFSNFVKASFELPVKIDESNFESTVKTINEAIDKTRFPEAGPVHINIPFREPLYNTADERLEGRVIDTTTETPPPSANQIRFFREQWNPNQRILILAGQMDKNEKLNRVLNELTENNGVVVLTETTSNLQGTQFVDCIDNVVSTFEAGERESFHPDLLITFGGQVVSKMIKKFLRESKVPAHWHISPSGEEMDTYFCLTETIGMKAEDFFAEMQPGLHPKTSQFAKRWKEQLQKVRKKRNEYLKTIPYCDLQVFDALLHKIPAQSALHLGNSTPVRYSQLFGQMPGFDYLSNRGVSGIDGQVSTAAGAAFASNHLHTLITGDLGFFYDSNALMNHNLPPNLRIVVINNGGGGIFRFLDGPASTPQMEEFFVAKHHWKAEKIAEAFGVKYYKANDLAELTERLPEFYTDSHATPALLEIFTPAEVNAQILKDYFLYLKSG
ncbi:MAG: 2-succinyl-5-enolpyruvyl-6-hydroxy-3-cyclohexene-1-carboxylic-acid synthase [Bacteroidales bacterium]|nr:2-succinyl-5-enolpyruvyl-6-hydroxy-3-cyclohexene-1-carboxylic-acid synthase [Bacteroidales bacterium]MCF6342026.1 2-succinyl-5-enolpyruvyl-6-hydroxy-3-cyclohexene-1-carboxylic-acid synthase [Bacteroidales bacterium]